MRIRIHRGAHEIGGNCIEVEASGGARVVLDVGRPLSAGWDDAVPLPPVDGLDGSDPSLLGIVISHPHLDHYGLLASIDPRVPVWIGREAAAVLDAAAFFTGGQAPRPPAGFLEQGVRFEIGPFAITPFLNDHSAFDAYSLLIEADGLRVFYTGDLRAHGRKASCFEALLADPPGSIDALLMEGTHVRADSELDGETFETEAELEARFIDLCQRTTGAVVVCGSAQNLDRLVTVFRAGRRSGRETVIDLYGATVAAAARPTIPQPGFDGLRVYVPNRQRVAVKRTQEFWRTRAIAGVRVFPEEVAAEPGRFILHVPASTVPELLRSGALDAKGTVVWSMWEGYLRRPNGASLARNLADRAVPFEVIHTSGHASVTDLRRLVAALDPGAVVPIHSEATGRFAELFPNVQQHADGEWWEVR